MRVSHTAICLFFFSCYVCSASPNSSSELIDRLFKDYNAQASPHVGRQNHSGIRQNTQHVSLRLSSAILASVNERDWTNSILVSVNYKWFDPRLAWDPATEDGISAISMKKDAVWQPTIYPCESLKVTPVFKDMTNTEAVSIQYDGSVYLHTYQVVQFICQMDFDEFPFDHQDCSICFALDDVMGGPLVLEDVSQYPIELQSISEWDVVKDLRREDHGITQDGVHSHRARFHFTLARRGFFWIFLIVIPTCLFCLITLIGIFFYEGHDAVHNAASIGLTTMTSLMLVVIILSDALDKANDLPGLGWFVFTEITVVCVSVIALLMLDGVRAVAFGYERRYKDSCTALIRVLTSKKAFRAARFTMFLFAMTALIQNPIINWT